MLLAGVQAPGTSREVALWALSRIGIPPTGRSAMRRPVSSRRVTVLYMAEQVPISEAETRLGSLVRQTSHARVTLTDDGEPAAVLINPQELVDMEEALALADFRTQQAAGTVRTVPQDEVRARLGFPGG